MEFIRNKKIKERLSRIAFAPHGAESSVENYSNYFQKGGNVFHIHGEGNEEHTRKTFAKWLLKEQAEKNIFTIFQVAHNDGNDPDKFEDSRFSFNAIKSEIEYNLRLTGLKKIDAIYLAEDNLSYPIEKIQECTHKLIATELVNHVGLFNWTLERLSAINDRAKKRRENGISYIITTELSILKPNFGIWDGYVQFDDELEKYIAEENLLVLAWTTNFNQSPLKGKTVDIEDLKDPRERMRWTSEYNIGLASKINHHCKQFQISPSQLNISFVKNRNYDSLILIYEDMKPTVEDCIDSFKIDFSNFY